MIVECGSIPKKRTNYGILLLLVMAIASRFLLFHSEVSYPMAKIDCVGHIQKKLGTRLRNLVKKEKFADGSRLGGKGNLTKARIDSMQNYFGQAIRSHSHDIAIGCESNSLPFC